MSKQQTERREAATAPARDKNGPVVMAEDRQAEDHLIRGYD